MALQTASPAITTTSLSKGTTAPNADETAGAAVVSSLDVDAALERAGGFGVAQILALVVMGGTYAVSAWGLYLPLFHADNPAREVVACMGDRFRDGSPCIVGQLLAEFVECDAPHSSWRYVNPLGSVSAEWNLICSRSGLRASIGSIYMVGNLIGNVVLAWLCDARGRCPAFCACTSLAAAGYCLCSIAPSFDWYLIGQCSAGFGLGGLMNLCWVWAAEMLPSSQCSRTGILNFIYPLGILLLVGLEPLVPRWRVLTCLCAVFFIGCTMLGLAAWCCGLESPAWCASQGDAAGVQRVAALVARMNGCSYTPTEQCAAAKSGRIGSPEGVKALASVSRPFLIFSGAYTACRLGYQGLSLSSGNLGGGKHTSTALMSLVEMPAVICSQIAVEVPGIGRRGTLVATVAGTAAFCFLSAALPFGHPSLLVTSVAGKFLATASFNVVMVYAAEVFPAAVRSSAMGWCNIASKVVAVAIPTIVALPAPWPSLVIGGIMTLLTVPVFSLSETSVSGKRKEA